MKKCWGHIFNDCSNKMSNEHYVGRELLGNVEVIGLHSNLVGKILPSTALKACLLCTKHNSELSETDTEAKRFYKTIFKFFKNDDIFNGNGLWTPSQYKINGSLIRRWLCKLHCNLTSIKGLKPAEYYVRTAFGEQTYPYPRVFVWMNVDGNILTQRRIRYEDYTITTNNFKDHKLFHVCYMGLNFVICPFDFTKKIKTLLAEKSRKNLYLDYWMEKPSKFIWRQNDIQTKTLLFDWDDQIL